MKPIYPISRTLIGLLTALAVLAGLAVSDSVAQDTKPADPTVAPVPAPSPANPPAGAPEEKGLRLNFRGVPLDMVLSYLSDAAGFIIVLDTEVKGKIDVWSSQPLSKDEAVELLNTVLNKNGYAAIRNGRTLRVVSRDDARTKDIPVKSGSDPESITKSDEMVTQVIPVRYANAAQLVQNLKPLLATYAELSANESGNALVLTATQSDVRRMVQIVSALDTSISSVADIRVFPLRYADAKELANAVKELFQPPSTQNNNDRRNQFFNRFFGGPGGGGFPGAGGPGGAGFGGNGGGGRGGGSTSPQNNTRVVAVADERANALVVSAPGDLIPTIEKLVEEMDVSVADITELRVFHLLNADPLDIADIMAELFPDDTRTGNNNGQQDFRFRGGQGGQGGLGGIIRGGGGGGNANNANANASDRMKKKGRVLAVPDQRTSSIIVSAASEYMPQIAAMIEQLDQSPAKKQ
ncbi:MAG TPA: secretin N-terminal domain-containing protein, partial [Candidatus Dormibacteraeota bacterium]|nr:secretin N-terminal domain-containing protein [Candidatus Dormibacteraeota bacterium]